MSSQPGPSAKPGSSNCRSEAGSKRKKSRRVCGIEVRSALCPGQNIRLEMSFCPNLKSNGPFVGCLIQGRPRPGAGREEAGQGESHGKGGDLMPAPGPEIWRSVALRSDVEMVFPAGASNATSGSCIRRAYLQALSVPGHPETREETPSARSPQLFVALLWVIFPQFS